MRVPVLILLNLASNSVQAFHNCERSKTALVRVARSTRQFLIKEDAMSSHATSETVAGYPSIMVAMDRGPEAANRATLATGLADRFSARLIGVAAQPIAVPMYIERPMPGIETEIELEEHRVTRALAGVEASFRGIAGSRNHVEWRQTYGFPTEFA